jgi:hypothetical protein
LRIFFALLLIDPTLPDNSEQIFLIKQEVLGSAVWESFLESAPQLILQSSIVLRTGNIGKMYFFFVFYNPKIAKPVKTGELVLLVRNGIYLL